MKRFLTLLSMCLPLAAGAAGGENTVSVETAGSQMVLYVHQNGEVSFYHYGARFDNPDQILGYKSYRRWDYGTEPPAYPARGGRHFNQSALAVKYQDGNINTELAYTGHTVSRLSDDVARTVVKLRDAVTSLEVSLFYDAYYEEDVIVSHAEITNAGTGPVLLESYASSGIVLDAREYLLTHFHGAWAREMQVESELLTHGIKSIRSIKGVRTTHTENPSFMLSLDTDTFSEESGDVIAGALAWSGNYSMDFQVDETNRLSVISGVCPDGAAYADTRRMSPLGAVKLIAEFGGVPVLAHPKKYLQQKTLRLLVEGLKPFGLKGIETYYPTHSPEDVAAISAVADRYGMVKTGGSDYHGEADKALDYRPSAATLRVLGVK